MPPFSYVTDEDKPDVRSELRDVALLPIVETLLSATGPTALILTIAEAARQRVQHEPVTRDREFWRIVRKIAQSAADEIDKTSEAIGSAE